MVERIRPRNNVVPTPPDPRWTTVAVRCQDLSQDLCIHGSAWCDNRRDGRCLFDVDTRTFYRWMNKYPELSEAVSAGKEAFDTRVERALAERAIGYSVDVEEWFVVNKKLRIQDRS